MRAIRRFDEFLGSQRNTRLSISVSHRILVIPPVSCDTQVLCVRRIGIYALTSFTPKFGEEPLAATEEQSSIQAQKRPFLHSRQGDCWSVTEGIEEPNRMHSSGRRATATCSVPFDPLLPL